MRYKNALASLIVFCILCCTELNPDHIYNLWYYNDDGSNIDFNASVLIDKNNDVTWTVNGIEVMGRQNCDIVNKGRNVYFLKSKSDTAFCFNIELLSTNVAMITSLKWDQKANMIDEVVMTYNKSLAKLPKLDHPHQEIELPGNFTGKFYIAYTGSKEQRAAQKITINENGIGFHDSKPEVSRLFLPNRKFKIENAATELTIITNRKQLASLKMKEKENEQLAIIQLGYNKLILADWNSKYGYQHDSNIEYFMIDAIKNLNFEE